jgi:hypothetical protein
MYLRILTFVFVALVVSTVAFAQADAFQVAYAANIGPISGTNLTGDSYINITNAGTVAGTDPGGTICANVYAFDPAEELISCCTCAVTPNGLNSLDADADLISNTLTPGSPTSIVIKIVATLPVGVGAICNAGNGGVPFTTFAGGLRAWATSLHLGPAGDYQVTENVFQNAVLSDTENIKLTGYCNFIQADGSGFGICKSCAVGGLGATKKK